MTMCDRCLCVQNCTCAVANCKTKIWQRSSCCSPQELMVSFNKGEGTTDYPEVLKLLETVWHQNDVTDDIQLSSSQPCFCMQHSSHNPYLPLSSQRRRVKKKKKTPAYLYLCGQSDQRTVLLCKKYKWTCVAEGLPLVLSRFSVIEIDQLEQTCCQGNQCTSTANMTDLKWLSQFITHKASACSGLSNHTKLAIRAHRAENINPEGFRK